MATALSRQLAQFKGFVGKERTKASLIHDPKDAANLSSEDIFRACVGGFKELCKKDRRFEPYGASLFAGVPKEREQRTKQEDERVNESITSFLRILVDHFLEPAAFKALEHLIRSYKVNECNVDALMSCALAYHETREFVDLLGTLHLDGTIWHWLTGVQNVGVPLPRSSIVQRCTKDMAVLSFLGEMAKWSAKEQYMNQRVFSLYATVVCEVLITVPQVTEELMQCLVKFIVTGLIDKCQDYRSASYLIVVTLSEHAALSDKLMAGILEALVRGESGDHWSQVLTIMSHLYKTQEQYKTMSGSVLKSLVNLADFASVVGRLVQQGLEAEAFLTVLSSQLVDKSLENPSYSAVLCALLAVVKFPGKTAAFVAERVLGKGVALGAEEEKEELEPLIAIIRVLDCHFPEEMDREARKKLKHVGQRKFMECILSGTLHTLVQEKGNATLLVAVDSAKVGIRTAAMLKLESMVSGDSASPQIRSFANEAILRRLEDDNRGVVMAALCCPFDGTLTDPIPYHNAVMKTFDKAWPMNTKVQKEIVEKSLAILSKNVAGNGELGESTFAFLIGYIMPPSQEKRVDKSQQVMEALGKMPAPYGPLIEACLQENGDEPGSSKVISHLISKVGDSLDSFLDRLLPLCAPRSLHILFLAIDHACSTLQRPSISTIALKCVDLHWNFMELGGQPNDNAKKKTVQLTAAASLALHQVLLSTLRGVGTGRLEKPSLGQLKSLFLRILGLCEWENFDSHAKEMVKIVQMEGASRFLFLAEVIGSPEETMSNNVVMRALPVLFQQLKEKDPTEKVPPVVLACVLGCMASPVRSIRGLVQKNFRGIAPAFSTDALSKKDLAALTTAVAQGCNDIQNTQSGIVTALRAHSSSLKGVFAALETTVGALTEVSSARAAMLLLSVLPDKEGKLSLCTKGLPLLSQLTTGKPPSIMCKLGIEMLSGCTVEQFTEASLPQQNEMLEGWLAMLERVPAAGEEEKEHPKDGMDVDGSFDGNGPLTLSDLRVAAFQQVEEVFEFVRADKQRGAVIQSLLRCSTAERDLYVRKAARECLERVQVGADDLIGFLQMTSSEDEETEHASKRRKTQDGEGHQVRSVPQLCLLTLELIQWKEIVGMENLLPPVQELMRVLLDCLKGEKEVVWEEGSLDYVCRLCLADLKGLVERIDDEEALQKFEGSVVVEFLRFAPDASVRNEAMGLLRVMVDKLPSKTLDHILEIFRLMGESGVLKDDEYSRQLATETFSVAVPAWIEAGKGLEELWMGILYVLLSIQPRHRRPIMTSLVRSMPEVEGCAVGLFSILKIRFLSPNDCEELINAAKQLGSSVPISIRGKSLARLSSISMPELEARDEAAMRLHAGVLRHICVALKFHFPMTNAPSSTGRAYDAALSSTFQDLLYETISQLSAVGKFRQGESDRGVRGRLAKITENNVDIVTELKNKMDAQPYIKSLVGFIDSDACYDGQWNPVYGGKTMAAHALSLYTEKLKDMEAKGLDYYGPEYIQEMGPAAMSVYEPLQRILSDSGNRKTLQLALGAIQAAAMIFSPLHPASFPGIMESVSELVETDNAGLKGSALVTLAALVKGLKLGTVPHLPKFVPAVLGSAEAAASRLTGEKMKQTESAEVALELAASLSVIEQIVVHLGDFASPYVEQILGIVSNPKVLGLGTLDCGDIARRIGLEIPKRVPPRLMFEPIFHRFDAALEGGQESLSQLLEVVGGLASRLDPKSAASYSEQIFVFLLQAFEIRQKEWLPLAVTHNVEAAAISAFLELVMKLSEKDFKPLFVRMVEWSHIKAEDAQERENLGRQVFFFRLVGELARRLRSMFVGYFDHFLEEAVKLLLGIEKRKKNVNGEDGGTSLRPQQELYQLRLYLVRALHRCAVCDMVGFLTPEKIEEVGPALVRQVKVGEPLSSVTEGLEFLAVDSDLEGNYGVPELDVLGTATVASLVNLAVAGGSEETWKALNLKVVKASRKGSQYVKILVLEFEKHLVTLLKEDFLSMVPETLPRLAEFLEDSEPVVSNRARDVIKSLEKMSGESYDQYLK